MPKTRRSPNILFIQQDQLAPQALSFHGNKVSKTPHIDQLMRQGVVYTNAYCCSPICTPSRMAMMAGMLPTQIGAWDNAAELSSEVPTIAHCLRMQGYETALAGKMHFVGADQLHGFEERLTTDVYPADFGWAPNWDEEATGKRNPLFFETFVSVAEADWVHSSVQMEFDEEVAFRTRRKLRQIGSRRTAQLHRGENGSGTTRPFFILASFTEPHDPYSGPKEFWDRYEGVEIDAPQVPFIPRPERDSHSQRVYDCMDSGDFEITPERVVKSRRAYYSMMSYVDSKIGEILQTLEEQGLRDDTLVVFTADHGDMQGERGMWFKETYHERATRVPFFFSATPALVRKYGLDLRLGQTVTHNVSHADLLPTLLHLALSGGLKADWKAELPSAVEGRSLLASLVGEDSSELEDGVIYCEYTSEMIPGGWFMVKKGGLKLVYSEQAPLLFDLIADPKEMSNLAGSKDYEAQMADLLKLAREKWPDLAGLTRRILVSQRQRRYVHAANVKGKRTHWDFEPVEDPRYPLGIRNTSESLQDQEYVRRAPYRGKRPRN